MYFTHVYVSILQSCSFDFCKKSRKEWRLEARDRYWHKADKTSVPFFVFAMLFCLILPS